MQLELVSNLSTPNFLLAFIRFISRKGKPLHLYSNNGKTFVNVNKKLKDLGKSLCDNQKRFESFNDQDINWLTHLILVGSMKEISNQPNTILNGF